MSQEHVRRATPTKRQDTFDLRDHLLADEQMASSHMQAHADATNQYASGGGASDEEHSVLEDDSDGEDREMDYMDDEDDRSSSLSIPNESIDFDLVYSLHSFAATVEGQASVVKGDSLFLMDDTNSYWWLVRVLKTQDVGYIPAENIETPFERLARLNKHRNVDLAHATPQELQEDVERVRNNLSSRNGSHHSRSPTPGLPAGTRPRSGTRGVMFTPALSVHRYPPAVWNEDEEEEEDIEWEDGAYEEEDPELAEEMSIRTRQSQIDDQESMTMDVMQMEPDDGMSWDESAAADMQARSVQMKKEQQMSTPDMLRPGSSPQKALQQRQLLQTVPQHPQQQQQELIVAQQRQQQQQEQQVRTQQALRQQSSWDRLSQHSPSSPSKINDPVDATETRKLSVTPPIVRDEPAKLHPGATGAMLQSTVTQQQEDDRKRAREELETLEEAAKKKAKGKDRDKAAPVSGPSPVSNQPSKSSSGGKLRKEREPVEDDGKEKKEKKSRGGVFGLFGRKKDKNKDKASIESISSEVTRESQESGQSASQPTASQPPPVENPLSPVTTTAIQQQQQPIHASLEVRSTPQRQQPFSASGPQTPSSQVQVSQHASTLRQRDQQQQALYQQYLNRSPSSPPEAPSYGLQSAFAGNSPYSSPSTTTASLGLGLPSSRPRPGSLVISPAADGQGLGVPELSVIRIFAGKNVQTEATFKTVLLNSSTTSSDLIRQAIQRFRLPSSEVEVATSYYLTIKQVEGSSTILLPEEKPLVVFESVVEAVMELPRVKRSSMGSISSVSSNLSMHPAITQLSMNDFTDDSAVKFYLNKRGTDAKESLRVEEDEDESIYAESSRDTIEGVSNLSPSSSGVNVTPERFSSPSFRFALQLVIYPEDLPDDMVFDPLTEAIVFKHTLKDRTAAVSSGSGGVSQNQRRKVFTFPKNVTVAEVIELGLERFGILEGVVDGGDEVEDKLTKRRSSSKVRYWLTTSINGQERELSPSSKVVDAYPRPPTFRRVQDGGKRRSIDSALLLGNVEDVSPDDPLFILRRAVSYRASSSRHRMSAPLDEIALQHLRDSISGSSLSSDNATQEETTPKLRQLSRQEIIAAQRAASREKQRAILSTQTNSVRGVDVLLPGNAMIRSSRYDAGDRIRYSYVQDGESYDVSDIIEQEFCEAHRSSSPVHKSDLLEGVFGKNRDKDKDGLSEKLDRVLAKIKDERLGSAQFASVKVSEDRSDDPPSAHSTESSSSTYSDDSAAGRSEGRTPTPLAGLEVKRTVSPSLSDAGSRSRSVTPTPALSSPSPTISAQARSTTPPSQPPPHSQSHVHSHSHTHRQPSIASVLSDMTASTSVYATPTTQLLSPMENELSPSPRGDGTFKAALQSPSQLRLRSPSPMSPPPPSSPPRSQLESRSPSSLSQQTRPATSTSTSTTTKRPYISPDDFGVAQMLAVIEAAGTVMKPYAETQALHPVEEMLFGKSIEVQTLHPEIREIYSGAFQQLDEMDKMLDEYLQQALAV